MSFNKMPPAVFLCHASDDKSIARELALRFQSNGIDTFFDEWEIGPGDSLRQKIDLGLTRCTHFVVLLTPSSIHKPWVNAEIDAGFVRKVEGNCRLIPLRYKLGLDRLPPLLRALHSPELTNFESDSATLIDFIHDVTVKPALGLSPPAKLRAAKSPSGLSPAAELLAREMIERSENGNSMDPQLDPDQVRTMTGLSDDSITDAVDELESRGLVEKHVFLGSGEIGFGLITPNARLFAELDQCFQPWSPEQDAKKIAADLVNGADGSVQLLAGQYGWAPRRMNPAIAYLIDRRLIDSSQSLGTHPWCTPWISKTSATRRWVQAWS